ncbi:MAG: NADH-quinone oxidoreductase subunit J [Candidatus Aminicenantes bacterium]|nr:NADH-quinone oxidoreductase subunit J [Candidatus Aminicenantes bacterium]
MWNLLYWILFVLSLAGLGFFLFSKREDRAVASLSLTFASIGGIFALIGHPFLGTMMILIYAGAVIVGFIFVVWLVTGRSENGRSLTATASLVFLAIGFELLVLFSWFTKPLEVTKFSVVSLGEFFLKNYLYLFELTSLIILTAVISSLVIVRRKK